MRLACNAYTQVDASLAAQSRISLNQNEAMMPPMVITHANGFHKELWEPVLARLDPRWAPPDMYSIDCRNQGDSAILNKDILEDSSQLALKRRDHWKNRDEAKRKLTEKKLFASWHPEVMDLYLKYGLVDASLEDGSSGVTLKTPKFQEAATFAAEDSAAYDAFDRLNEINIPVHIIAGENSEVNPTDLVDLKVARCKHGSVDVLKNAGHLFPMDSPAVTGKSK
ncbi:hypothetical protein BGZ82_008405 [Podila clonocystis]|nr:hypothetical protein BGZ82_008405 [Podila clonocystis]